MPVDLNTPLSLYSIPLAYLIAFYPHNKKFNLIQSTVGWDNLSPRENVKENLVKRGMDPRVAEKVGRLGGAHQNGNETYPLWAAAVIVGNLAGLEQSTLNLASGAYISLRLLFNYLYINQATAGTSWMRTGTFFTGLSVPFYLLIKAANKMRVGGGF